MEVYDTNFCLLEQETVDGRHIYLGHCFFVRKEEVIPQEKIENAGILRILTLI